MAEAIESEIHSPLLPSEDQSSSLAFVDEAEDLEGSDGSTTKIPTLNQTDSSSSLPPTDRPNPSWAERSEEPASIESLDYDPIHSAVSAKLRKQLHKRRFYGYTGLTLAKWTITILIGILVGSVAYVIAVCQELVVNYKKSWTQNTISSQNLGLAFVVYASFGMLLVALSSCLVLYWAPAAAGGGVTLVMAYLNGNDIPDLLQTKTLVTKIFGTICTISSGLPIGQEGPMVHIGAAIASTLTWMHCESSPSPHKKERTPRGPLRKCNQLSLPFDLYNDKDRREFISAGAAAGLAASFGSPVGGVLYSLEEASSFWSRKVMWRSLVCTTVATMILDWLQDQSFSFGLPGTLSFHGLQPEFVLQDLPLFVVTSAGAGVLGTFVIFAHGWLACIRPVTSHRFARILEACFITLVCVAVIFGFPFFWGQCLEVPESDSDTEFWFAYNCQQESTEQMYNDLATLFFSVPHQTIKHLLELGSSSNSYFTVASLGIHAGSFFVLFIISYGIATPGGIFMPSMMVGASFGALMGTFFKNIFPSLDIQPGLHALIGATSMLGGLFRATISLVVIVVEGTGGIDFLLPIILAIVISNWVAHHIHQAGAYEADLETLGHIHFLHSEPPRELITFTAADIMSPNVIGFKEIVPVAEVATVLQSTSHNGFPVFKRRNNESGTEQILLGLILRSQLLVLLEKRAFIEVNKRMLGQSGLLSRSERKTTEELRRLERAMQVYHHRHNAHRRGLSSLPEAVEALKLHDMEKCETTRDCEETSEGLNETQKVLALDLRPFTNRAPLTVRGECSAQRAYIIFRTLGLRHLCVIDAYNKVIGMITRKDIAHIIEESKLLERKKSLLRWDSDMPSFYDKDEKTTRFNSLYSLP